MYPTGEHKKLYVNQQSVTSARYLGLSQRSHVARSANLCYDVLCMAKKSMDNTGRAATHSKEKMQFSAQSKVFLAIGTVAAAVSTLLTGRGNVVDYILQVVGMLLAIYVVSAAIAWTFSASASKRDSQMYSSTLATAFVIISILSLVGSIAEFQEMI
jgi:hypothetical protein